MYSMTGPSRGDFHLAHLWFLLYLFLITLIALPIITRLSAGRGQKAIDWLAGFTTKAGAIYLYALAGVVIALALAPVSPRTYMFIGDWSYDLCMLCLFLFGFIFCMDSRFWDAIERHRGFSLGLSLVVTVAWVFLWSRGVTTAASYSFPQMLYSVLWVCTTWFYLLAIMGYARRYLSSSNRFLAYASQASLPFYVLHVTVVVTAGYFIVRWNIVTWAKFLLMLAISFAAIVLVYEFIIRRVNIFRFLFGMRMVPKKAKIELVEELGVNQMNVTQ
jgi:glucan biosynthesis protein C